jgi:hypothetical protein
MFTHKQRVQGRYNLWKLTQHLKKNFDTYNSTFNISVFDHCVCPHLNKVFPNDFEPVNKFGIPRRITEGYTGDIGSWTSLYDFFAIDRELSHTKMEPYFDEFGGGAMFAGTDVRTLRKQIEYMEKLLEVYYDDINPIMHKLSLKEMKQYARKNRKRLFPVLKGDECLIATMLKESGTTYASFNGKSYQTAYGVVEVPTIYDDTMIYSNVFTSRENEVLLSGRQIESFITRLENGTGTSVKMKPVTPNVQG